MYGSIVRNDEYISQLSDFIGAKYGISVSKITPAKRGYYGETWKIDTDIGSYFVKLDYSAAHKKVYERSFHVIEHINNHGMDFISRIVKTSDGRPSVEYDGACLGIFEWIDGENVQNEQTKTEEYKMLAKIYTVPHDDLQIPSEKFNTRSADMFFSQLDRLKNESRKNGAQEVIKIINIQKEKITQRSNRLELFARRCTSDTSDFYITHGDAGGNIITCKDKFYIVDWDDPTLAPPERDAWFCIHWDWATKAFEDSLRQNGIEYTLCKDRMAFYCYHSFFFYLAEYMNTYFDIGKGENVSENLKDYFNCWIEEEIAYADKMN